MSNNPAAVAGIAAPMPQPAAAGLAEIRTLILDELPPLAAVAATGEALGDFAGVWRWLSAAQRQERPGIHHPRVALFMASHGAYPERQTDLPRLIAQLKDGRHAVSPLVRAADADLQVYELDLAQSSADFRTGKAMSGPEAAQVIAYGMMAVQPGVDFLLLCAPNPVADLAADEIMKALKAKMDPLDALLRFGGYDIAAMTGALVAARLARVPVLLEGRAAEAAAAIVQALRVDAAAHTKKTSAVLAEKTDLPVPCAGVLLIPLLKSIARAL